jgi:hypothetical protein
MAAWLPIDRSAAKGPSRTTHCRCRELIKELRKALRSLQ